MVNKIWTGGSVEAERNPQTERRYSAPERKFSSQWNRKENLKKEKMKGTSLKDMTDRKRMKVYWVGPLRVQQGSLGSPYLPQGPTGTVGPPASAPGFPLYIIELKSDPFTVIWTNPTPSTKL